MALGVYLSGFSLDLIFPHLIYSSHFIEVTFTKETRRWHRLTKDQEGSLDGTAQGTGDNHLTIQQSSPSDLMNDLNLKGIPDSIPLSSFGIKGMMVFSNISS